MSIFRKNTGAFIAPLSSIATALGTLGFATAILADSHVVREDLNAGIIYNSALSSYRSMDGSERREWKRSNDTVAEIGGWRTYANQAYEANKRKNTETSSTVETGAADVASMSAEGMKLELASTESAMQKQEVNTIVTNSDAKLSERITPKPAIDLSHQSATSIHRSYEEVTLQNWKAANDRVGEIGGWRVYANEAYQANKKLAEETGANQ